MQSLVRNAMLTEDRDLQPQQQTSPPPAPSIRNELDVDLEIEGTLPTDLHGHVFIVGPVGTLSDPDCSQGNTALNGDGMVYRLDFNPEGTVHLKSRLLKPFEYRVDEATHKNPRWKKFRFKDYGVVRFSKLLGVRNELNTAFLPIPTAADPTGLLVTYDVGRPYRLDPVTLDLIVPMGTNQDWRPAANISYLFPPFFSTAHPVFDPYTEEFFAVNYGRSLSNYMEGILGVKILNNLWHKLQKLLAYNILMPIFNFLESLFVKSIKIPSLAEFLHKWRLMMAQSMKMVVEDFTYLICWKGQKNPIRWNLVLPDGSPVRIKQTVHQIGITEDYVILLDTSFKTGLGQLLRNMGLQRVLRFFKKPNPNPNSLFYIIKRNDLRDVSGKNTSEDPQNITVRPITIPGEASHFLTDYENTNQQITLHVSHICAWDVADWMRLFDKSPYEKDGSVKYSPSQYAGYELNPMDVSRLGRYIVDGQSCSQAPCSAKVISDTRYTWGTGLYTYLDRDRLGMPPKRLKYMYWTTFGRHKELMTKFSCKAYQDYRYQQVPQSDFVRQTQYENLPGCLICTDVQEMNIVDVYQFPIGYFTSSPQFIPRFLESHDFENSIQSNDGYISCNVYYTTQNIKRTEIWIFDGKNLKNGPICKLYHKNLKISFTLHGTWLPFINAKSSTTKTRSPLEDYKSILEEYFRLVPYKASESVKELFFEVLDKYNEH